jgi:glyoxylase-like metal-dependent hydrolase (beta-lactamase superfamily II)
VFPAGDDAVVFSGDLVFAGTIGRSDFANSDPEAMEASLRRFLTLPDGLVVLPGHGPRTDVATERATNPHLRGLG